ncbi:urease accessory protein UreF [Chelativorans salis]|uniref:Urease accessory protein UreF n=1 Tax=Chelativorans salis TaxID=2978478 RepID=A0ABT2LU61_9HYPH|nr:urease accessory protein UreF [Chelativorans sp. EGI FJ00035]MCT7377609.1 urease accessory protein UreF [Chelativorans sp. EGI FJ00035]
MSDVQALQKLLTWASPAFPVGAFAYSAGLESAIEEKRVTDSATTRNWIEGSLKSGAARNDAILASAACRAHGDTAELARLADLCLALTPARQRHEEMLVTGKAFTEAANAWPDPVLDRLPDPCPYAIAFGAVAGASGIAVEETLVAFLTAYTQAQISVSIRLVPLGQTDGLAILATLEPLIAVTAETLSHASLDDLGSAAYAADIAAMEHETLPTRIFRS